MQTAIMLWLARNFGSGIIIVGCLRQEVKLWLARNFGSGIMVNPVFPTPGTLWLARNFGSGIIRRRGNARKTRYGLQGILVLV